jgi:hypothetical protein
VELQPVFHWGTRTLNLERGPAEQPDIVLKVTLSHGEFELVRWAQRLCRQSREKRRSVGVAQYARGALMDAVGKTISEVLARPGGFIPPELAGYYEDWLRVER